MQIQKYKKTNIHKDKRQQPIPDQLRTPRQPQVRIEKYENTKYKNMQIQKYKKTNIHKDKRQQAIPDQLCTPRQPQVRIEKFENRQIQKYDDTKTQRQKAAANSRKAAQD